VVSQMHGEQAGISYDGCVVVVGCRPHALLLTDSAASRRDVSSLTVTDLVSPSKVNRTSQLL